METRRILPLLLVLFLTFAVVLGSGCGSGDVDLTYNTSGDTPVITYYRVKAIAPVYNPTAPVTVLYGDGTVIEKHGSYKFSTGLLPGEKVQEVLQDLSSEGFFKLKEDYTEEPLAGGTTEELTVNLTDKKHTVTVLGGQGPANWEKITETVTGLAAAGADEYLPETIILHASVQEGSDTAGARVMDWPGGPNELVEANSAGPAGLELKGEQAKTAWKAIQEAMDFDTPVVWKAGDGYYDYVYATPVFPGIAPPEERLNVDEPI